MNNTKSAEIKQDTRKHKPGEQNMETEINNKRFHQKL